MSGEWGAFRGSAVGSVRNKSTNISASHYCVTWPVVVVVVFVLLAATTMLASFLPLAVLFQNRASRQLPATTTCRWAPPPLIPGYPGADDEDPPLSSSSASSSTPVASCLPTSPGLCRGPYAGHCGRLRWRDGWRHPDCAAVEPAAWVRVRNNDGDIAVVEISAEFNTRPDVHCNVSEIIRLTDFEYLHLAPSTLFSGSHQPPITEVEVEYSDVVHVSCTDGRRRASWSDILLVPMRLIPLQHGERKEKGPALDDNLVFHTRPSKNESCDFVPRLNVLIWMADGLSRGWAHRTLPKSMAYIRSKMGGVLLKGYTQVGLNSLPNMIPLWTGVNHTEWLRPACGKSRLVEDLRPLLFEHFRLSGYVTAYYEDAQAGPDWDTVYWRLADGYFLRKFRHPPADHYSFPFMYNRHRLKQQYLPLCVGGRSSNAHAQEYAKSIWELHTGRPKFFFFAQGAYSHNRKMKITLIDDEFLHFLKTFLDTDPVRRDTLVVIMSDHGNHVEMLDKLTAEGILDQRMPLMYLVLPQWMESVHSSCVHFLRENAESRLTTVYDVHETLLHLIHGTKRERHERMRFPEVRRHTPPTRLGQSLFVPIPSNRTCASAGVALEFCSCLEEVHLPLDDDVKLGFAFNLAERGLAGVNNYLSDVRELFQTARNLHFSSLSESSGGEESSHRGLLYEVLRTEGLAKDRRTKKMEDLVMMAESCPEFASIARICSLRTWRPQSVPGGPPTDDQFYAISLNVHHPPLAQLDLKFVMTRAKTRTQESAFQLLENSIWARVPETSTDESLTKCMEAVRIYRKINWL